jgi:hypothetical protein
MKSSRINIVEDPSADMIGGVFLTFYPGIFEPQYDGHVIFIDPSTHHQTPPIGFRQQSTGTNPSIFNIFLFDDCRRCSQHVAIENFPSHKTSWNHTSLFVDIAVDIVLAAAEQAESVAHVANANKASMLSGLFQCSSGQYQQEMKSIVTWFLFFFPDADDNTPQQLFLMTFFDVTDADSTSFLQSLCTIPVDRKQRISSIQDYSARELCAFALRQSMVVFPDPVIAYPHQFFSAFSMIRSLILLRRTHYDQYEILADCVASDMLGFICEDETFARTIVSTVSIPFFQIRPGSLGTNPRYPGLLVPQASLYPYPNFWDDFRGKLQLTPAVKNFFGLVQHQCNNDLEYLLDAFVHHIAT